MVQRLRSPNEIGYGYPSPSFAVMPAPVAARRDPTAADTGYSIGQGWVNMNAGTAWALVTNAGGLATWLSIGGTLTPTVANITSTDFITATAATSTKLNGKTWSAIGTDAAIGMIITPKGTGGLTLTSGDLTLSNGNLLINHINKGIQIKEGANSKMGHATLVAGTVTVANTSVTAASRIFLTRADLNGSAALGLISVGAVVAGATFDINALNIAAPAGVIVADVSIVNWLIIEAL